MGKNAITTTPATKSAPEITEAERDFMSVLATASDGFAGFWEAESEGERIMGTYQGKTAVLDNDVHKIRVAFPTRIWADDEQKSTVSTTAPIGAIVAVWDRYQLRILDRVNLGTKVAIVRGKKESIKGGKTVINFTVMVDPNGLRDEAPALERGANGSESSDVDGF
jgi:hypothetical protein